MDRPIIVIADHAEGRMNPATPELVSVAAQVQHISGGEVLVVVFGDQEAAAARDVAGRTGLPVQAVQVPGPAVYDGPRYQWVLSQVLPPLSPDYVIFSHNTETWDYVPALALRLGAPCLTGVTGLFGHKGRPGFKRSICNGSLTMDVIPERHPALLTVSPGAFKADVPQGKETGPVTIQRLQRPPTKPTTLEIRPSKARSRSLAEADVVVAAGRGVGTQGDIDLIRQLASMFKRSAVGGSRLVCDSGWLGYSCQVGLTGATVRPRLYVACGISGAPQHLAGMSGSEFIVAINRDPHAAIFTVSDVGIVEDLTTFIPALLEVWRAMEPHRDRLTE